VVSSVGQIVNGLCNTNSTVRVIADASNNIIVNAGYKPNNSNSNLIFYNFNGSYGRTTLFPPSFASSYAFLAKYLAGGIMTPSVQASSNVLVDVVYTPSNFAPFANGYYDVPTKLTLNPLSNGLYVGGPSNYFSGSISELLVYSTNVSSGQRISIEGYLAKKWNISLPSTHPYYIRNPLSRYFLPTDIPGCSLWMDGADNATMNSTTAVTVWNDKSGLSNTMTGTGTWSGSNMTFNGSTNAFSNTTYVFSSNTYSMFGVYSNTTAPAAGAYMNAIYASNGYPMLGVYSVSKYATVRAAAGTAGATTTTQIGWVGGTNISGYSGPNGSANSISLDTAGNIFVSANYSNNSSVTLFNSDGTTGIVLPNTGGTYIAKYTPLGAVSWASNTTGLSNILSKLTVDPTGSAYVTYADSTYSYIKKYTNSGGVVWTAKVNASASMNLGTDSSGNVFIVGYGQILYNQDGTTGITLPASKAFVAKYTSAGVVSWAAGMTVASSNIPVLSITGFTVSSSGNVIVCGSFGLVSNDVLTFSNANGTTGATLTGIGNTTQVFIAQYTSAGVVAWAVRLYGSSTCYLYSVTTDTSNNVYTCGYFGSGINLGGGIVFSNSGVFLAKYSSTGTTLLGFKTGTPVLYISNLAIDSSGNICVCGAVTTNLQLLNSNGTTGATLPGQIIVNGVGIYAAKYNSAGTVLWGTSVNGQNSSSTPTFGITTNSSGDIFVAGVLLTPATAYNIDGGSTPYAFTSSGSTIVKFPSDGYLGTPVPASSNVLVSATSTSANAFSRYVNGYTASALTSSVASNGLYIGGPSNYFSGSISELIIYNSTLTLQQRQAVEGYLTQKWGLGSQIVPLHPYGGFPPAISQPAQQNEVTVGSWTRDWQPYLKLLVSANATGVSLTTTNITGGAVYTGGQWVGGVLSPQGNIYFAPYGTLLGPLKLNVSTNNTSNIGAYYGSYGAVGGVLGPDSNVYFNAGTVIKLDTTNDEVTYPSISIAGGNGSVVGPDGNIYYLGKKLTISTGAVTTFTSPGVAGVGAVLGPDGNVYFTPSSNYIAKLNTTTGITTNITGGATYTSNGWTGGVLGPDGNIYFAPTTATNILKLNVITGVTTNITGGASFTGGWAGGVLGPDGNIYFAPYGASNILKLNVSTGVTTNITAGASYTGTWRGGILAPDGNIYFAPYSASNILKITFSGLSMLPSSNYCLSAYANKF
jgi:streptogramin lyase